jgi:hypothetical protein
MAIDINKSTKRIDPPVVTLTGRMVDVATGQITDRTDITVSTQDVVQTDLFVDNSTEMVFYKNITVTVVPDGIYPEEDYTDVDNHATVVPYNEVATSTNIISSGEVDTGLVRNEKTNTYYTLNGKDPKRTKANLYTRPFTIRRNTSGGDNIILKLKTYARGMESKVRKIELRVIDHSSSLNK